MDFRIMASRHSAFYSPLLSCVLFLRDKGHRVDYSVLAPGQRSHVLLGDGQIDVMQSAVSSNWTAREQGIDTLPVHFAQINRRDGFFLVGRTPDAAFEWKRLEGRTLLADHGQQPLAMLKYAVHHNGVDWNRIEVVDAGSPERMQAAFAAGSGDYLHLQAPIPVGEVVASVGAAMPPVAFSSLCCSRNYQETVAYREFLNVYQLAREWVRSAAPQEVATAEAPFFAAIPLEVVSDAIARYQQLGCWQGDIEIPRELYEQALDVFQYVHGIAWRHPYEEVVG